MNRTRRDRLCRRTSMPRSSTEGALRQVLLAAIVLMIPALPVRSQTARTVVADQPATDQLTKFDPRLDDGSFYHLYRLSAHRGERLTVRLSSDEFDTYLIVTDEGESFVEENDDRAQGDTNSEVTVTVDLARDYYLIVTSYLPGAAGRYTLNVASSAANRRTTQTPQVLPSPPPAAEIDRSGRLDRRDPTLAGGEYYEGFTFRGLAGELATIEVSSDDFDTYAILIAPDGSQTENDDARGSSNSYLEHILTSDGEYEVLVTSYEPGETGAFRVSVQTQAVEVAEGGDSPAGVRTYKGNLSPTEETLAQGEYVHSYEFEVSGATPVEFELISDQFDAYLIVEDEYGTWIQQNDDHSDGSTDAGVSMILPRAGTYRLLVTTYSGGETGRYTLRSNQRFSEIPAGIAAPSSATQTPAATSTTPPNPPASTARPGPAPSGPTYHGVFVGISDYPGRESDLEYCADDAADLRQVFVNSRYGNPDELTLLTDSQATRARTLQALRDRAAEVDANDTLVFFFSGHGDSVRSTSERDGKDETIELYDGALLDDELAGALSAVRGRVIIVIDSCYSAGFAKDVITRPGWFGIFSSEEDVVSYVADEFRAGGYLSHFFQSAVSGDADGSTGTTRDRRLTMSELERYLLAQWYGRSGPSADSNQHLRFERNGVSIAEVLFEL